MHIKGSNTGGQPAAQSEQTGSREKSKTFKREKGKQGVQGKDEAIDKECKNIQSQGKPSRKTVQNDSHIWRSWTAAKLPERVKLKKQFEPLRNTVEEQFNEFLLKNRQKRQMLKALQVFAKSC